MQWPWIKPKEYLAILKELNNAEIRKLKAELVNVEAANEFLNDRNDEKRDIIEKCEAELVKERARKEFLQKCGAAIQATRGYGYYDDAAIDAALKEKEND